MQEATMCDASDFCYELSGGEHTTYARVYGVHRPNRVLDRAGGLFLLADMSPLMMGHCLLVPQKHYLSFGQAVDAEPALDTHFQLLAERYRQTFGELSVVEHGSATNMRGSACILHAHLHLFPLSAGSIVARIRDDGLRLTETKSWDGAINMAHRDEPYYMVSSLASTQIASVAHPMPKQYLRRAVGSVLGIDEALSDWAIIQRPEALHETVRLWNERPVV